VLESILWSRRAEVVLTRLLANADGINWKR
jgi:hypothetical protein